MLKNLKTVNQWYQMPAVTSDTPDTLKWVFREATGDGGSPISYFFNDIYIPLRDRDNNHAMIEPPQYTYVKIGYSIDEITDAYMALYGYNMLSVPLPNSSVDPLGYTNGRNLMAQKIKAILNLNKGKYLKWIETMGYAYNPLWNVDGVEEYQWIDNHGNVVRTDKPILATQVELNTASYDGTTKPTQSTSTTYSQAGDTMTATSEEEHDNIVDTSVPGVITAVTGGDYSHIEKRVRQGNIGVTMTTQLIQAERELVKFNLIQEFFNDINKQYLVGIFPGF